MISIDVSYLRGRSLDSEILYRLDFREKRDLGEFTYMKKNRVTFLLIMLLGVVFVAFPSIASAASVTINGTEVFFSEAAGTPFLDAASRVQVPLRATMEAAGCDVLWDEENQTAIVEKNGITVRVPIGQPYIIRDNVVIENDSKAVVKDGRTYLPIRAVFEAFGGDVKWDSESSTVIVSLAEKDVSAESERKDEIPLTAKEIAALASPAVFYMEIFQTQSDYANNFPIGTGSGFFITADGVAVTNYHVVKNATVALITMTDGSKYRVSEILYYDEKADYAVIRISNTSLMGEEATAFPYLETRDSTGLENGEVIYTIGSPLGLQNSISNGIISNRDRLDGGRHLLQITAPISQGSSGGALIDEYGNAIGITTGSLESGQNVNLAIPLDEILMKNLSAKGIPFEQIYEREFLKALEQPGGEALETLVPEQNPSLKINYEEIGSGQSIIGDFCFADNQDYYYFATPVPVYAEITAAEYTGMESLGVRPKDFGMGSALNLTLEGTPGSILKEGTHFVRDGIAQVKVQKTRLDAGVYYIHLSQSAEDFNSWNNKFYYLHLKLFPETGSSK